ncbi:MAG: hypothetical protein PUE49_01955 [Eggerthellales bacterium]|nr:hypothetical protein [Eggerthellales bacterium]
MSLMYRQRTNEKTSWHGAALLTEALILLAFLVGCLAVFFNLLASAGVMGKESTQLTEAVALASNVAEEFAADPTSVRQSQELEGYQITCTATPSKTEGGTLYDAHITVYDGDDIIYELDTARYVSEVS